MTNSKQVSARVLLISVVCALCVTADRLSKEWALTHLSRGQPEQFLPGILRFTLTTNPGAAFSIGSQNGQIMCVVATVLSIVILAWIIKRVVSTEPLPAVEQIGMGCLFGGALGNLIDRYTVGQVTDFLEFSFVSFPVFNVADALIDVGIGCLFIAMYLLKRDEQNKQDSANSSSANPKDFASSNSNPKGSSADQNSTGASSENGTTSGDLRDEGNNKNASSEVEITDKLNDKDNAKSNISSSTGGTTS